MKKMIVAVIVAVIIVIIASLRLTTCLQKNKIKFDSKTVPYSKQETAEYSYKINSDVIAIKSDCGNLKIKRGNVDEVKVTMEKLVGGKSEDKLQDALNAIKCTLENGVISIKSSWRDKSIISSVNIETIVVIPNKVNSLNIQSNVGNIELEDSYEDLKVDMENGNISYNGDLKKCSMSSKVGNVNLTLKSLDSNCEYEINGEVVNAKVKVPKESKINLMGSMIEKVKVKDKVNISEDGAVFDINIKTGNVKIEN